jgi:hypothetical protein
VRDDFELDSGQTSYGSKLFAACRCDLPMAPNRQLIGGGLMSALGQKQTLKRVRPMSALPPKADIDGGAQSFVQ